MKKKIEEGNRLIAEFMGGELGLLAYKKAAENVAKFKEVTHGLRNHPLRELKYHSSWDWLMPVVEKINKWFDEESDNYFDKILEDDFPDLCDLKITEKIERVWMAVVQFIKWKSETDKLKNHA